jgi:type IV pilus assembly protein PilP
MEAKMGQRDTGLQERLSRFVCVKQVWAVVIAGGVVIAMVSGMMSGVENVGAQPVQAQVSPIPIQQVSVPPGTVPGQGTPVPVPPAAADGASMGDGGASPAMDAPYTYNPSGRRDPFATIVLDGPKLGAENLNLPPLQRTSLTELSLIGIVWGGFGYTAMVQTADGKGYTVRQGTKVGPNNGVVSVITENSVVVQERFVDVYGKKQVREYVKLLHQKENTE